MLINKAQPKSGTKQQYITNTKACLAISITRKEWLLSLFIATKVIGRRFAQDNRAILTFLLFLIQKPKTNDRIFQESVSCKFKDHFGYVWPNLSMAKPFHTLPKKETLYLFQKLQLRVSPFQDLSGQRNPGSHFQYTKFIICIE